MVSPISVVLIGIGITIFAGVGGFSKLKELFDDSGTSTSIVNTPNEDVVLTEPRPDSVDATTVKESVKSNQTKGTLSKNQVNSAKQEISKVTGLKQSQIPSIVAEDLLTNNATLTQTSIDALSRIAEQSNEIIDARKITNRFMKNPKFFEQQIDTKQVDPRKLAQLSKKDRKRFRLQKELSIPNSVKFSTSLAGSAKAVGEQFKRDENFKGKSITNFKVTNPKSTFQRVLAREQGRAKAISNALFGNVANPNFDLGLPSTAKQKDRDFAIRQQQERRKQLAKAEANRKRQKQRESTGSKIRKNLNINKSNQKQVLKSKGINLNTSNLSNKTLAILREKGLI